MIANVVVFTPPPVPPGEAPMNMSRNTMNRLAGAIAPMSIVLNPAVRAETDWK